MDSAFKPNQFVSGGQTGGDSVPFPVYEELGVKLVGFMPNNFKRDDGCGRQIAERHGLQEGEGGYKWRDKANAALADALVGFLTTLPLTGRGTMQTANIFVAGEYDFVKIEKPMDVDHLEISPRGEHGRPVLIFWDISTDRIGSFAEVLRAFLEKYRPKSLMFSGPVEKTWPGMEHLGAEMLRRAFQLEVVNSEGGKASAKDLCNHTEDCIGYPKGRRWCAKESCRQKELVHCDSSNVVDSSSCSTDQKLHKPILANEDDSTLGFDKDQMGIWRSLAQQAQHAAKAKDWQQASYFAAQACSARPDLAKGYLFHAKALEQLGCPKHEVEVVLRHGLEMCTAGSDLRLLQEAIDGTVANPDVFSKAGNTEVTGAGEYDGEKCIKKIQFRSKVKGLRLLPHELELVETGRMIDITHNGSSSIWLSAESTHLTQSTLSAVYRPMGDIEFAHLLAHGVLPNTQPYQTIVEGDGGRRYAEKYLRGHKSVDSSPTTVVEFVVPRALKEKLFDMQSKIEDGAISHGLGNKGGKGLPFFNAELQSGQATWRVVLVKRFNVMNSGPFGTKKKS
eukprot:gnl/MRDRNA2_/MRDRNA2_95843_c0_seq1.p1 gnl/MRDRNA2_/MRDRNA2_95843_c0~~gnl/MRDRNA2_/MRDRNA2_95843_c0_seq1.p1  ORF type:complete len:563 (+),score=116.60 gnl/MRDRNA2_/MRDRNA2_95843_c0_seq1:71-1759(+)